MPQKLLARLCKYGIFWLERNQCLIENKAHDSIAVAQTAKRFADEYVSALDTLHRWPGVMDR